MRASLHRLLPILVMVAGCSPPPATPHGTMIETVYRPHKGTTVTVGAFGAGQPVRLHTADRAPVPGLQVLIGGKAYTVDAEGAIAAPDDVLRTALKQGGIVLMAPGYAPRVLDAADPRTGTVDANLDPLVPLISDPHPPATGGPVELPGGAIVVDLPAASPGVTVSTYQAPPAHLDESAAAAERARLLAAVPGAAAACDKPMPCPPPTGAEGVSLSFAGPIPAGEPINVTYDLDAWLRGWNGQDPAPWTTDPGNWTPAQIQQAKDAARILATFAAIDQQGPAGLRDALANQFGLTLDGHQLTFSVTPTSADPGVVEVLGSSLLGVRIEVALVGGAATGSAAAPGAGATGGGAAPPAGGAVPSVLGQPAVLPPIVPFPADGAAPPNGPAPNDDPVAMPPVPASLLSVYGSKLLNSYGTKLVSNNGGNLISDLGSGLVGHVQAPFKPELAKFGLLAYTEWPWPDVAQVVAIDVPGAVIAGPVPTDGQSNYHIATLPTTPEIVFVMGKLGQLRVRALTGAPGDGKSTADLNTASTAVTNWVLDEVRNRRADLSDVSLAGYAADMAFVTTTLSQAQAQWVVSNDVPTVAAFMRGLFAATGYQPKTLLYGVASTVAGNGAAAFADGPAASAAFKYPYGLAFDPTGNLLVVDTANFRIRALAGGGTVSTLAGSGAKGATNGPGPGARFWNPRGVVVDAAGNAYVADSSNHRIRKIAPGGATSTLAGGAVGFADGPGASARFNKPIGLAIDASGNLYVGDTGNGAIRKIDPSGNVTTLAGNGTSGYVDGPAANAEFSNPIGLAVDPNGNVFVGDSFNYRIRVITPAGRVLTLAGDGTSNVKDGTVDLAEFGRPSGLAIDARGYVYIADFGGCALRRLGPTGTVRTIAGGQGAGYADGVGAAAKFTAPDGVAIAPDGSIYIGDSGNNRLRRVVLQH